ncbi:MAG: GNAT family N-acetyltransferase [Oscillospiraceae bacterium]|jgi:GNAT superfamily N-acetyltransferase|nr:GNAT family N-acetyltransferase [Oscillospiraceae bacterium]
MYDTIRVHSAHEAERVAALAREIWTDFYTPLIGAEQVAYMLANRQSPEAISEAIHEEGVCYDLMMDGERDIAYCAVLPEKESLFVSKMYVRKEYRKKGIARLLLRRAVNEHPNAKRVWLYVHKRNESVEGYKRMGFVIEGEAVTDIGGGFVMDDYIMARPVIYGEDL